jgi:hypothetical protein
MSPVAIPASDWTSTPGSWTPSSWQTVGSAGGYTYSIACGDSKAYAPSTDWNRPKYQTALRGKIQGNGIASELGGSGSASAVDQYQNVYHPPANPDDPNDVGTYTWDYVATSEYSTDLTTEFASTFSRTDGQVVKLWAHIKVTEHTCSVSDVKLYVWS